MVIFHVSNIMILEGNLPKILFQIDIENREHNSDFEYELKKIQFISLLTDL